MELVTTALELDNRGCDYKPVRVFLQAFGNLAPTAKNILVVELLKQVSLVGMIDSIEDRNSRIVPFTKPFQVQKPFPITQEYSRSVSTLLEKYNELPESCYALCLSELIRLVPIVIIVGAFDAVYGGILDTEILIQPGYYIFPATPSEQAAKAISNACQAFLRISYTCLSLSSLDENAAAGVVLEQSFDVRRQSLSTQGIEAFNTLTLHFNALTYRQKLLYASELLQRISLYGIVRGNQVINRRTFPLIRSVELRPDMTSGDQPFFALFDSLPDTLQSSCLAAIFRTIPISIIVGALAEQTQECATQSDVQPRQYVFPASPAIKALPVLTGAYRAFGV